MKKTHTIILYSIGGIIALGAIAAAAYLATPIPKTQYATTSVKQMNITETVTGTGTVAPDQQSILAFDQTGGTIATVDVVAGDHVQKGQTLGTLRSDILEANLENVQAGVTAAQANLNALEVGAKPADVAVYTQKKNDAETALASAIHDSYLKTEDAVQNQISNLFNNPGSANPTINVHTETQGQAAAINNEYITVASNLANLKADLDTDSASPTINIRPKTEADASTTLASAKAFMADLGTIATNLNTLNSGLTQTQINSDRSIVNTAATEVATAISGYTTALAAWSDASASLNLEQSSSTPDTLEASQAQVAAAQAQVATIEAQINHTVITAPFDGVITDVEPKVGEVFSAGTPAFTIMSDGVYKIEVYVSENDVAKLAVGDSAQVTLDAYGSSTIFPASVTAIDPAETVTNGVNSYKVTLHFAKADPRIISGMTANVSITAAQTSGVIAIPSSAVVTQGSTTFVLVRGANGTFAKRQIQTGITGNDASTTSDTGTYVEVKSGLAEGDVIAAFGTSVGQ